ncbi:MAG: hypothetical protein N3A59_06100 [Thermodesulfovibrionales bacterium]|nr:hypothetical protein [Thermodesulfovibrionales bacterium]
MDVLNAWLVDLNKNSPFWFGIVTVLTMSGVGVLIAVITELFFKLIGVKGERIEIHH